MGKFSGSLPVSAFMPTNPQGSTTLTFAVGTPGYMPSEQSNGKPKLSSDIYAVGMVGIKALTGKDPHNLPTDQDTENIIWRNEAKVSNYLANILDKMVREYFRERYKNATEVLEALNIQGSLQPVPVATPAPTIPSTPKIKPVPTPQQTPVPAIISPVPKTQTQFDKTRRQILILGGLAGSGFVAAILSQDWWSGSLEVKTYLSTSTSTHKFETVTVNAKGQIINRSQGQAEVMTDRKSVV